MKFDELKAGEKFRIPKEIDLSGFGPQCPLHGTGGRQCSFVKTKEGRPPRQYFGSGGFTNAKRVCDDTAYDFSSVWHDVVRID